MDTFTEQQLSHALLERLEPLIHTAECQLRDLSQGQVLLHSSIAELSSTLNLSQEQLDSVHDTFAKLPLYIAKLNAMKNTIASVTVQSRKLKRRADQVAVGREKQAVKSQAARAKEQAYDQTIAAVPVANASPTTTTQRTESLRSSSSSPSPTVTSSNRTRSGTPTRSGSPSTSSLHGTPSTAAVSATTTAMVSDEASAQSLKSPSSTSMSSIRLPFPLPAKPAFPIISSTRSLSGSGSPPPSLTPRRMSPTAAASSSGVAIIGSDSVVDRVDAVGPPRELVDRFPQVSSSSQDDSGLAAVSSPSAVEVVRLRRKKKAVSKSSASSVASISTTASAHKDSSRM